MPKFLPCPFCGGSEDELCTQYNSCGDEWVQCSCGAEGPSSNKRNDEHIVFWNIRVQPKNDKISEVIEDLLELEEDLLNRSRKTRRILDKINKL